MVLPSGSTPEIVWTIQPPDGEGSESYRCIFQLYEFALPLNVV